MLKRLHAPGPPHVEVPRLRTLLHALDDHEHLEHPAGFDADAVSTRFEQLVRDLEAAFAHRCRVDRHFQDASHHGVIRIPAQATATGEQLMLVVSNFGDMVVCAVGNTGARIDAQTDELIDPQDADRVRNVLARLRYLLVPEDPLWQPYDGSGPLSAQHGSGRTWYDRYFTHL
ncbi:hypothetical protein [Kineococcus esterisolvens]|uniref:hypothetical protein n=1 Tax=unclassified Kineococcus TaxID=2621656 RepID=UPI003D7CF1A4